MKNTSLCLIAAALLIAGCTMHRIDIQQGNIITPEMLQALKVGMNREQVRLVMGTPLIIDSFDENRWVYLYSMQRAGKPLERRHVIVEFADGRVAKISNSE